LGRNSTEERGRKARILIETERDNRCLARYQVLNKGTLEADSENAFRVKPADNLDIHWSAICVPGRQAADRIERERPRWLRRHGARQKRQPQNKADNELAHVAN